ncbi:hypothetical protein [Alcanivorax sp. 24]|uniref:hypothetical protein n=1 Tax=Alcanivorax sp. 24 TaxID=2545266 RepID=UPI00196A264F|nr:hypothetical protein [Alcanivorax sp. 24]
MTELGEAAVTKLLSTFACNRNADVENFLKHPGKAIRFEQTDNARTYLILDADNGDILAYFSVSFKELVLEGAKISKNKVRQLDGISKHAERIRAFLIGQIGKNSAIADNPLSLASILDEIYAVVSEARALVGGRIIILECEDCQELIDLYKRHGFTLIDIEGNSGTLLRTMYTHVTEHRKV